MPTNDERRKVAARLRELAQALARGCDDRIYERVCGALIGSRTALVDEVDDHIALARLADLIEPEPERTCRVVTEMRALSQTQDMHTKSCSSCGYVFGSEQHRQLLPGLGEMVAINPVRIPKFCPNCGAKVAER